MKHAEKVNATVREHQGLIIGTLIGSMVTMIAMTIVISCFDKLRRTFPTNFICLGVFTLATTFVVTYSTIPVETDAVAYCVGFTAVIVIGLTIFAMQTKIDFTVYYQLAFVLMLILMIFGLTAMISQSNLVGRMYALFGAIFFCFVSHANLIDMIINTCNALIAVCIILVYRLRYAADHGRRALLGQPGRVHPCSAHDLLGHHQSVPLPAATVRLAQLVIATVQGVAG